jgi:hypothetical protein
LSGIFGERIGEGVFSGQLAGGALVVGADLTLGQLVEKEASGLVQRLGGDYFAA